MFCLRSWVPLLVFLTNAPPIYVLLFLTGTYFLNRPCVYCSLLLIILTISLFDFRADWFEPRNAHSLGHEDDSASSLQDAIFETASLAASMVKRTVGGMATSAVEGMKKRIGANATTAATSSGSEWIKSLLGKKQFRIPCVDVQVML